MGHSNITMTLGYYAHGTFNSAKAELERLALASKKEQQIENIYAFTMPLAAVLYMIMALHKTGGILDGLSFHLLCLYQWELNIFGIDNHDFDLPLKNLYNKRRKQVIR